MARLLIPTILAALLCICSASPAADVAAPPSRLPTTAPNTLPYRGGAIRIDRVDWIDRYKKTIDEIAAVGDTVCFVVSMYMEDAQSNVIWLDLRMTPTPDALVELIRHAKSQRLRVMLLPTLQLLDRGPTEWRGAIRPGDWDTWFDNYRSALTHFAWIAQGCEVDVLSVGSELISSEERVEQWRHTIAKVREVFKGQIVYQASWDHYAQVPFWDQLDMIGMNAYWKVGTNRDVPVDEIEKNWREIRDGLVDFSRKLNKPLIFTEVGWHSLPNAAEEPWDYTKVWQDPDLDLQKRLFEEFFEAWHSTPCLGGIVIYAWSPDAGGPADKGYTPKGKPTEAVIREWFARPGWEVQLDRVRPTTHP